MTKSWSDRQEDRYFSMYNCGIFAKNTVLQSLCYFCLVIQHCFVGHFSLFCWVEDLCSYQTVRPTRPRSASPAYPFILVRFANTALLILPPEAYQHLSEISPLTTSETCTQRRRLRIGTGSPHSNCSVNGASDCTFPQQLSNGFFWDKATPLGQINKGVPNAEMRYTVTPELVAILI